MSAVAHDQFPSFPTRRPADQGVCLQDADCVENGGDSPIGMLYFVLSQMSKDTLDVIRDFGRQLDACHAQRAIFLATGFATFLPCTRACRYAFMSAHAMVFPVATILA